MFFVLPLIGAAVGAVAGALVTHAAGEKDRQAAQQHRNVANELYANYSTLEKSYNELANKSKEQINGLERQLALAEADKDLLRLALRLQQVQLKLMLEIDKRPLQADLTQFKAAVFNTNQVLSLLNEPVITIPDDYFTHNMARAKKLEKKTSLTSCLQQPESVNTTQLNWMYLVCLDAGAVNYTKYLVKKKAKSCSNLRKRKTSKRYSS